VSRVSCDHGSTEYLGSMGNTLFHQCECGDVLISQDGRKWVLRGTPIAERRHALAEPVTVAASRAASTPANGGLFRGIARAVQAVLSRDRSTSAGPEPMR